MARLRIYLVSALLCCCVALGQGDAVTTQKTVTVTVPSSSAAPATSPASTEPPATTTEPSTTQAPTTTTAAPTTTTAAPTTTTPAPTTTSAPTTTPAPVPPKPEPTPAPKPTPVPAPEQGTWSYKEGNITCIVVQFAAQLNVTYYTTEGNSTSLAHALLNVPKDAAVVAGACQGDQQWLQISWPNTTWANNMTLQFRRNATTHQYALRYLNVTLTPDQHFVNASSNASIALWHAADEWWTPLSSSYKCLPPSQLNMSETAGAVATLSLSHLQEEAFRDNAGTGFSAARECGSGDVPDAVPIAVGCALGGLVVVVLIAYLVSRRRSAARGYLSM